MHSHGTIYPFWPTDNDYEVIPADPANDNMVEMNFTAVSLENGRKYSLEVIAVNHAGLASRHFSPGVVVDVTPPVMKQVWASDIRCKEELSI